MPARRVPAPGIRPGESISAPARGGRRAGDAALAGAADQVDDAGGANHGQYEAAATAAEEKAPDDARHQRAADSDEDRLADTHRVGPRDRQATEGTDDQAGEYEKNDEHEHGKALP